MSQHIVPHLETFRHGVFGKLRAITIKGEPWFFARDAAMALGYENPAGAAKRLCTNPVRLTLENLNDLGMHLDELPRSLVYMVPPNIISEPDLYNLILSSKLPKAKRFKNWVVGEVLPALRKKGEYSMLPRGQNERVFLNDMVGEYKAAKFFAKEFGYRGSLAKTAAIKAVKYMHGVNLTGIIPPLLPHKSDETLVTPTFIGKKLGISAIKVNKALESAGFQTKTRGLPRSNQALGRIKWRLTEEGRKYGAYEIVGKYSGSGTIERIGWSEKVIKVLSEKIKNGLDFKEDNRKNPRYPHISIVN